MNDKEKDGNQTTTEKSFTHLERAFAALSSLKLLNKAIIDSGLRNPWESIHFREQKQISAFLGRLNAKVIMDMVMKLKQELK